MQIPVLNGIFTDENSDFRTSYPRNMIPVPKQQGISSGYLRPSEGINHFADVFGVDRGGINWNGSCYRACGTRLTLVRDDGTAPILGEIGGSTQVTFDYSFDRLAVASNGNLFYYINGEVKQVTDADLGNVIDVVWVDGHFMTTDGEFLVVTDLSDPFAVNPLKYGSSEVDPDPIKALLKLRNEVHAVNRYTIEVFDNIGGTGFPFQRIDGAQITRGSIGTHSCCIYLDALAFLGGGRNEPISIWLGSSGNSQKISSREIDQIIRGYTETQLESSLMESRSVDGHQWLYLHLPNVTLVYDASASQALGQPVWFKLSSGLDETQYLARNHVWCYDKWLVGHPSQAKIGYLTNQTGEHWGELTGWEFGTMILYNESNGAIFHELELVCLSGRADLGKDPVISTQYSLDGESWSQSKYIKAGKIGDRAKRLIWLHQGNMKNWRIQRFNGTSDSRLSVARLEARIEPLAF